jgi:hypothetical protein
MTPDYIDARGEVIARMNDGRGNVGKAPLTPRQEHLVREFVDDNGNIESPDDQQLLYNLLQSNSA